MINYDFFLELKPRHERILPFQRFEYWAAVGHQEKPVFALHDWCYNRVYYNLLVSYNYDHFAGKGEFILSFKKSRGESKPELYHDSIVPLLDSAKFKWHEESKSFEFSTKSKDVAKKSILSFCNSLNLLLA
jgi:hypothetical protein